MYACAFETCRLPHQSLICCVDAGFHDAEIIGKCCELHLRGYIMDTDGGCNMVKNKLHISGTDKKKPPRTPSIPINKGGRRSSSSRSRSGRTGGNKNRHK